MTSVVVVSHNGKSFTLDCVRSLQAQSYGEILEVIVVDNASSDGSVEAIRSNCAGVRLIALPTNRGFGSANNRGAAEAKGEFLFFLNNDTTMRGDSITALATFLRTRPAAAVVGPRLRNPDGTIQVSAGDFPGIGGEWRSRREQRMMRSRNPTSLALLERRFARAMKVDWVTGAAMMVRRDAFESVGGFDEEFFMYFEDADLCRRLSGAGYQVWHLPDVSITHYGGASGGGALIRSEYRRGQLRFYEKHCSFVQRLLLRSYLTLKYSAALRVPLLREEAQTVLRLLWKRGER